MVRLSAVIITYNEEKNIGRCLSSLQGIADEIVVVDSGSSDKTREICGQHQVSFHTHPFEGYIGQKNYATSLAKNDFILSIDADEALSDELRQSVLQLKNDWQMDGYTFNRLTNYCGRWIRHCGWYPDRKLRLFKKDSGQWGGRNPHDRFLLKNESRLGFIRGDLHHYSYYTIDEHLDQVNNFTTIDAQAMFDSGKRANAFHLLFKPCIRFIRDYVTRLGFLDGAYGFAICRISAFATFIKYSKLRHLQKNNKP